MDIETYDARERAQELRESLVEIEENRLAGRKDYLARDVLSELRNGHDRQNYKIFMR